MKKTRRRAACAGSLAEATTGVAGEERQGKSRRGRGGVAHPPSGETFDAEEEPEEVTALLAFPFLLPLLGRCRRLRVASAAACPPVRQGGDSINNSRYR